MNINPDFQDELDVYMILWKSSKERGKQFLNDKQLQMLVDSGRINQSELDDFLDGQFVFQPMNPNDAQKYVHEVVTMICEMVLKKTKTLCEKKSWADLPYEKHIEMRDQMFQVIFGVNPKLFSLQLYENLLGK